MPGAGPAPNILGGRGRTAGKPLSGSGGLDAIGGRATPGGSDGPGARPGLASPAACCGAAAGRHTARATPSADGGGADAGAQALAGRGRGRSASALGAGSAAAGPGAYRPAGRAPFPQPAWSAGGAGSEAFALSAVAEKFTPPERAAGDAGFRLGLHLGLPPLLAEVRVRV